MLQHALSWANKGWAVIPLCSPVMPAHQHFTDGVAHDCTEKELGKTPLNAKGLTNASIDSSVIRAWWERWPDANIGGTPPPGHVVVDIDGELDPGVDFIDTLTFATGKGFHRVYRDPESLIEQTQTNNPYWRNVDTRISGRGYLVLPPSTHRTGVVYSVVDWLVRVSEFPYELLVLSQRNEKVNDKRLVAKRKLTGIAAELARDSDDPMCGDNWIAAIGGTLAKFINNQDIWFGTLERVNRSLTNPLSPGALRKKKGIWAKEYDKPERKADIDYGWLVTEVTWHGYGTAIGNGDNLEIVPWSDFTVQAKGLVVHSDKHIWIVDFIKADGDILENVRVPSSVLASTQRLKSFLIARGMTLLAPRNDNRSGHGERLLKLLQSQKPPQLELKSHYGWCSCCHGLLVDEALVTREGVQSFKNCYADDELMHSSPVNFKFEADLTEARSLFKRLMALQSRTETAKLGAWLMMLWLRGQWQGMLPGISVDALAGVGKTEFFRMFTAIAGVPSNGDNLTYAVTRDVLAGNSSGFVWLDDVKKGENLDQLIRKAITQGTETKKMVDAGGNFRTTKFDLLGSVIVTGEGSEIYRQKALRDRFIEVTFAKNPSDDAEPLSRVDIGRASGALLIATLQASGKLAEHLDTVLTGVLDRGRKGQAVLRAGARILDEVMDTGTEYADLVDAWYFGDTAQPKHGDASEVVLNVIPRIWINSNYPKFPGTYEPYPVWYDEEHRVFWVNVPKMSLAWDQLYRSQSDRQKQLTSQRAMMTELQACGLGKDKTVRTGTGTVKYRPIPVMYSDIILEQAGVSTV